jgi:hypothetical protein
LDLAHDWQERIESDAGQVDAVVGANMLDPDVLVWSSLLSENLTCRQGMTDGTIVTDCLESNDELWLNTCFFLFCRRNRLPTTLGPGLSPGFGRLEYKQQGDLNDQESHRDSSSAGATLYCWGSVHQH